MTYYVPSGPPRRTEIRPSRLHGNEPFVATSVPLNLVGGEIPGAAPHWAHSAHNPWSNAKPSDSRPENQPRYPVYYPSGPNPWAYTVGHPQPTVPHHSRPVPEQNPFAPPPPPPPAFPLSQPIPLPADAHPYDPSRPHWPPRRRRTSGDEPIPPGPGTWSAPLHRPTGGAAGSPEVRGITPYKWAAENEYSPVLDVQQARILKPQIHLNPMLLRPADRSEGASEGSVVWDMLYPPTSVLCSADTTSTELWQERQNELATFPRMSNILIVSRHFPWTIEIRVQEPLPGTPTQAITCADVIQAIHLMFYRHLLCTDVKNISEEEYESMSRSYEATRSVPSQLPASSLLEGRPGLRRIDWLRDKTVFGGLYTDEEYIQERLGFFSPGVFVLECKEQGEHS